MRIDISKSVEKYILDLEKSAPKSAKIVVKKINDLAKRPNPPGAKLIRKKRDYLRIRAGDFRILYFVSDDLIYVAYVCHRKDVYKKNDL